MPSETVKRAQTPPLPEAQPVEAPAYADEAALARYIAEITTEMAKLAGKAGMPMLTYFLNLARVEAEQQAQARGGAPVRRGRY